jgi:hypothetical protein
MITDTLLTGNGEVGKGSEPFWTKEKLPELCKILSENPQFQPFNLNQNILQNRLHPKIPKTPSPPPFAYPKRAPKKTPTQFLIPNFPSTFYYHNYIQELKKA